MRRLILALVAIFIIPHPAVAQTPPLFTYPIPAKLADGRFLQSPQTISLQQVTELQPNVPATSGVVLIIYWSTLCHEKGHCDFGLIDQAVAYWQQRHKRIVLDVATIGFPLVTSTGVQSATPDWVMKGLRTYSLQTRFLSSTPQQDVAVMPDFRDGRFLAAVTDLVHQLKRYDGNPGISQIRIATGMMGEDNPLIGPLTAPVDDFSERGWLDYTRQMAELYFTTFSKTELEFDIGRLSWMAARGSAADRDRVGRFVAELQAHHALLAFDGLSSDCAAALEHPDPRNGIGQSLRYLQAYKANGGHIGLEAIGPATAPLMRDTAAIASVVRTIKPDRIVLFSDVPASNGTALLTALGYH
jgi:hypothetical protein